MARARLAIAFLACTLSLSAASVASGKLGGRVSVDGRPLAGATVSAVPFEEPLDAARREARHGAEPTALATVTTGSDGSFALAVPAAPGKDVLFRVRVEAKGVVPADAPGIFEAAETDDVGELPLRKAESLAGRVTGEGGRPVPGARITLTAAGRFNDSEGLVPVPQEAMTGEDGTFRFERAESVGNELVVEAGGLAATRVSGAKGGALRRAIALAPGATLSGSVRKKDGKPVAGALVRYEAVGLETRWVETDADGAFRLADLPARRGDVVADAGDDGFAEAASVTPGAKSAPITLVLSPPTVLEGRTLDVATSKVVPRVKIAVSAGGKIRLARSGADGRYRLRGVRPGDVTVRADEPRYVTWTA